MSIAESAKTDLQIPEEGALFYLTVFIAAQALKVIYDDCRNWQVSFKRLQAKGIFANSPLVEFVSSVIA